MKTVQLVWIIVLLVAIASAASWIHARNMDAECQSIWADAAAGRASYKAMRYKMTVESSDQLYADLMQIEKIAYDFSLSNAASRVENEIIETRHAVKQLSLKLDREISISSARRKLQEP